MFYNRFDDTGLYKLNEAVEITNENPGETKAATPIADTKPAMDTKLYALPLRQKEIAEIEQIIKSGSGIWKTDAPLKPYKGGPSGQPARIDNKPVYLAIRINSKHEIKREEADRVYLVATMTGDELENGVLDIATNELDAVSIFPKLPDGKTTHTVKIWKTGEHVKEEPVIHAADTSANNIDLGKELDKMTI